MSSLLTNLCLGMLIVYLGGEWTIRSVDSDRRLHTRHEHEMKLPPGTCNKVMCASIVSYCILQENCRCYPKLNCSCCRQCAICLGDYYKHCCDCVHMCEKNVSVHIPTTTSTVEYLPDPNAELYRDLTKGPIPQLKCTIFRFPIIEELAAHHRRNGDSPFIVDWIRGRDWIGTDDDMTAAEYWSQVQASLRDSINFDTGALCTVNYFDRCMAQDECRMSCDSMGAASFRWFHNGCCECVGFNCLNHGHSYPKCRECMT